MTKPFDTIYHSMDISLEQLDPALPAISRCSRSVLLIRDKIAEVQVLGRKWITGRDREIAYFREVWPVFFGRLFLYIYLYRFEKKRRYIPADAMPALIRRATNRVAGFLRARENFWDYYSSDSQVLDEQFTRTYSRSLIFDPLSMVVDSEWTTLASYEAARCSAMEAYQFFLLREQMRLGRPGGVDDAAEYSWDASDADFVEWLNGLQLVGAIRYKGQPADLSRLQKWAGWALNKQVVNIYDRFNVIRNRKKQKLVFTNRTIVALEKKMWAQDQKEK